MALDFCLGAALGQIPYEGGFKLAMDGSEAITEAYPRRGDGAAASPAEDHDSLHGASLYTA